MVDKALLAPVVAKKEKKPEAGSATPTKGKRTRGLRQTPEVLGFTMIRVIPGAKGKARMERRTYPTPGGAR